jgi:hypothetical protein
VRGVRVGGAGRGEVLPLALSNEISRVRFWEARLRQRPAGSALALSGSFGSLLADRAPAGSPVAGLLMGCRAPRWREHLIIRSQGSPGAVIWPAGFGRELLRVLFVGDDWAEDVRHEVACCE